MKGLTDDEMRAHEIAEWVRDRLHALDFIGPAWPVHPSELIPDEGFTQYDTATIHLIADVLETRGGTHQGHIARLRSIADRIKLTIA